MSVATRRRDDRGDTLVEILAAITILGIGVTALVTALGVMATTTVSNRSQARAETALLAGAEFVKTMPMSSVEFTSCGPTPRTLTVAELKVPTGFSVRILQGSALTGASCSQLVQLPVQVTGDGYTLSVAVVRRA